MGEMSPSDRHALTELERATGLVIDSDDAGPTLPPAPRGVTPRDALAESIHSHEELMERGGRYAELFGLQAASYLRS
jgi:hypothetical protein